MEAKHIKEAGRQSNRKFVLENQHKLSNCEGPSHSFDIADKALADNCTCMYCGGETQVVYAKWYMAGVNTRLEELTETEEDVSSLGDLVKEMYVALNKADKTGMLTKMLLDKYMPTLSQNAYECLITVLGLLGNEEGFSEDEE